jgi:transcriptional regulator with PAS, ATPase and Fis domain
VQVVSEELSSFHYEISKREERISELNSELGTKFRYHNMIGKSKAMQKIYHLLDKIKNSEATIMIQGENGTGKELVAKAIHFGSPRKDAVFLAVNCSAFNDNLLDSELFGHVKGAFTGAVKDKKGFFEMANGGTLFLDEIGDTSLVMQVKLLRVLQEGTFLPVGSAQPRKVNVRVIAATNKRLKEMIARGEFREDLYYRINVINVNLPPLRERFEDIPFLMEYFLEKQCAEMGYPTKQFSKKCIEKMLDYKWPGNVRELQNEVERLVVLAGDDKIITPDSLSTRITDSLEEHAGTPVGLKGINTNGSLKDALEELERMMIREGLKRTNFNKSRLAKELGVSRAGLIMKVEKYELDKRKKAAGEE